MTLIIGAKGSMGRRYQSILKYLNEPFEICDLGLEPKTPFVKFDRFIIASPTNTHLAWVRGLDQFQKPILCEKPLSNKIEEVLEIIACKSPLTMQMQYMQLTKESDVGASFYDYFHHGQDGLIWDCFQIIALSKGRVALGEGSPVWRCVINGRSLQRGHMDGAYVSYVADWLEGRNALTKERIFDMHIKVKEYEDAWNTQTSQ